MLSRIGIEGAKLKRETPSACGEKWLTRGLTGSVNELDKLHGRILLRSIIDLLWLQKSGDLSSISSLPSHSFYNIFPLCLRICGDTDDIVIMPFSFRSIGISQASDKPPWALHYRSSKWFILLTVTIAVFTVVFHRSTSNLPSWLISIGHFPLRRYRPRHTIHTEDESTDQRWRK